MFIPALRLMPGDTLPKSPIRASRSPETSWPETILQEPVIFGGTAKRRIVLLADPVEVRRILGTEENRFPKWLPIYRHSAATETGPRSIFALPDDQWSPLRKTIMPLFSPDRFQLLIETAVSATTQALLRQKDNTNIEILTTSIAIDVIWRTLMGDGPDDCSPSELDDVAIRMVEAHHQGNLANAMRSTDRLASIAENRGPGKQALPGIDFAGNIPPRKLQLDDETLRQNRLAFLYSGQETTALALCWTCWLLGQDSALQDRLRDEIRDVMEGPASFNITNLGKLQQLNAVLKETIRLFSPSVATVRTCLDEVQFLGQATPAGSVIVIPIYALHRHRLQWKNPDCFDPSRFSDEPYHPQSYIPFSAGRHTCVASRSAMYEMLAIVATLLDRMEWETQSPGRMGLKTQLVLTPTVPFDISFERIAAAIS